MRNTTDPDTKTQTQTQKAQTDIPDHKTIDLSRHRPKDKIQVLYRTLLVSSLLRRGWHLEKNMVEGQHRHGKESYKLLGISKSLHGIQ